MNVLHVNETDKTGGAAIACWRLHTELLKKNIDSRLLVGDASEIDENVSQLPGLSWWDAKVFKLTQLMGLHGVHRTDTFKITEHDFFNQADILHLHNLHTGYFSYLALPKLTHHKPAILTIHDMWPVTGHCAFSGTCSKWERGCGKCPSLASYPKLNRDGTWLEWRLKKLAYHYTNLAAVVVTSRWSENILKRSMLSNVPIHFIPIGIDTDVYAPLDSTYSRQALGIEPDKKVIMFSAQNFDDPRKGGDLLTEALKKLPAALKKTVLLLTMGHRSETLMESVDIPVHSLGFVANEVKKTVAYSAADVFVCPSREETFGMVTLEALACGTPAVGFEVGGLPDLVETGLNGYLARSLNADELAVGIEKCLIEFDSEKLSVAARATAVEKGKIEDQIHRYQSLYNRILKNAAQPQAQATREAV